MSKNRIRQRANKRKYKSEECLNKNNEFGIHDQTPYLAVKEMIEKDKRKGLKICAKE